MNERTATPRVPTRASLRALIAALVLATSLLQPTIARARPPQFKWQDEYRTPRPAEPEPTTRQANNVIYGELAGAGIWTTMNYERTVYQVFSMRLGVGAFFPASLFVPVTVSYHGIGTLKESLELGLGGTVLTWEAQSDRAVGFAPLVFAGYRYQPSGGGFFSRIGVNVLYHDQAFQEITEDGILPWPYFAVGGTF